LTRPTSPDSPNIKVLIKEETIHATHPINKCIRLINSFSIEAFIKVQGTNEKPTSNLVPKEAIVTMLESNNANFLVNVKLISQLAKQFDIMMPSNNDIKSTSFLRLSKEKMQTKLLNVLNKSNGIELDFKREKFQHYKGFIGRGNNSALFF